MFTGKRPWHPLSEGTIMYKIHIKGEEKKPPYPSTHISQEAVDFLNHCLEFDPKDRYTADQLLDHPFVKVCTKICNNDANYM
jgi:serine/threonine protein kinase